MILRNPCRICLVQACCISYCDDKYDHLRLIETVQNFIKELPENIPKAIGLILLLTIEIAAVILVAIVIFLCIGLIIF